MKSKANVMVLRSDNPDVARLDWLKWLLVVLLLLAGLVANHYYSEVSTWIRIGAWAILTVVAGAIAYQTQKGRWLVEFFQASRLELRKVVWPTREETTQTTMVVAAMVVVLALLLWGLDTVLVWVIGWLTGQLG